MENEKNIMSNGRELALKKLFHEIRDFVLIGAVLLFVFSCIAKPFVVRGISMEPTLHDGDFLFVRSLGYKPNYGDIVTLDVEDQGILVKRIIGLSGDTIFIDYENDMVFVNNVLLREEFAVGDMLSLPDHNQLTSTFVVPSGHVFVLGDNRNNSRDSRDFGAVPEEDIIGKPIFTLRI